MEATARRQDLPPEGGYKPINYKRVPAKSYFGGTTLILGYLGITAGAAYVYYLTCKSVQKDEIERRSANFAILPLLIAERDREYMRQLRRNRDEEADLMKNVEGWKVGTWYGEPIYKTTDKLVEPNMQEFYVHAKNSDLTRRGNLAKWS